MSGGDEQEWKDGGREGFGWFRQRKVGHYETGRKDDGKKKEEVVKQGFHSSSSVVHSTPSPSFGEHDTPSSASRSPLSDLSLSSSSPATPFSLLSFLTYAENRSVFLSFGVYSFCLFFCPLLILYASRMLETYHILSYKQSITTSAVLAVFVVNVIMAIFAYTAYREEMRDYAASTKRKNSTEQGSNGGRSSEDRGNDGGGTQEEKKKEEEPGGESQMKDKKNCDSYPSQPTTTITSTVCVPPPPTAYSLSLVSSSSLQSLSSCHYSSCGHPSHFSFRVFPGFFSWICRQSELLGVAVRICLSFHVLKAAVSLLGMEQEGKKKQTKPEQVGDEKEQKIGMEVKKKKNENGEKKGCDKLRDAMATTAHSNTFSFPLSEETDDAVSPSSPSSFLLTQADESKSTWRVRFRRFFTASSRSVLLGVEEREMTNVLETDQETGRKGDCNESLSSNSRELDVWNLVEITN